MTREPGCSRCGKSYKHWDHLFAHNYVRPSAANTCTKCGEPRKHRKHGGLFGHKFVAPAKATRKSRSRR